MMMPKLYLENTASLLLQSANKYFKADAQKAARPLN